MVTETIGGKIYTGKDVSDILQQVKAGAAVTTAPVALAIAPDAVFGPDTRPNVSGGLTTAGSNLPAEVIMMILRFPVETARVLAARITAKPSYIKPGKPAVLDVFGSLKAAATADELKRVHPAVLAEAQRVLAELDAADAGE